MNVFLNLKARSTANDLSKLDKTFIFKAYALVFYLCNRSTAIFISPRIIVSFPSPRYLTNLPFW